MARVLMMSHGTDGDVLPFIRIGRALRERGHDVSLLTHAPYAGWAAAAGLDFVAIDTAAEYERDLSDSSNLVDETEPGALRKFYDRSGLFAQLRAECREVLERTVPGRTVLVGRCTSDLAMALVATNLGVPRVCVAMAPIQFMALPGAAAAYRDVFGDDVDEVRAELGLDHPVDWDRWAVSADLDLGLWPRWFDRMGIPSPARARLTGFVLPDEDEPEDLPEQVQQMLSAPVAPVLFTGGTGRMLHGSFYELAVRASHLVERPAMLVVRHRDLVPDPLPPGVCWFPRLPFRAVMPRVAAVVHHGGIGTSARVLAAGVPQVIMAHGVDRPDNADRLARAGVATWLPAQQWGAEQVAGAVRAAIEAGPGRGVAGTGPVDCVGVAADAIERIAERLPTGVG